MKGFTPAKWALAGFALAAACAAPAANAEMVGRYHVCGKLNAAPFKAQLSSQGMGCSRARPLLRAWLGRSTSLSGEGMPRSTRAHHWQCRRVIAWACTVNGHKVRIVFDLDLRRHGDLAASMKAAFATGPAGQAYVDYGVTVRNLGSDVVSGRLVETLPANAGFVGRGPGSGQLRHSRRGGAAAVLARRGPHRLRQRRQGHDQGGLRLRELRPRGSERDRRRESGRGHRSVEQPCVRGRAGSRLPGSGVRLPAGSPGPSNRRARSRPTAGGPGSAARGPAPPPEDPAPPTG